MLFCSFFLSSFLFLLLLFLPFRFFLFQLLLLFTLSLFFPLPLFPLLTSPFFFLQFPLFGLFSLYLFLPVLSFLLFSLPLFLLCFHFFSDNLLWMQRGRKKNELFLGFCFGLLAFKSGRTCRTFAFGAFILLYEGFECRQIFLVGTKVVLNCSLFVLFLPFDTLASIVGFIHAGGRILLCFLKKKLFNALLLFLSVLFLLIFGF